MYAVRVYPGAGCDVSISRELKGKYEELPVVFNKKGEFFFPTSVDLVTFISPVTTNVGLLYGVGLSGTMKLVQSYPCTVDLLDSPVKLRGIRLPEGSEGSSLEGLVVRLFTQEK